MDSNRKYITETYFRFQIESVCISFCAQWKRMFFRNLVTQVLYFVRQTKIIFQKDGQAVNKNLGDIANFPNPFIIDLES